MQIGDLVRISSYGKFRFQNSNQRFNGDEIGIVVKTTFPVPTNYPIQVQWMGRIGDGVATRFSLQEIIHLCNTEEAVCS